MSQLRDIPEIKSSVVTEGGATLLGLKGNAILFVLCGGLLVQVTIDILPLSLIVATGIFFFIRQYVDAKPRHWLYHIFLYYFRLPHFLRHRPDQKPVRTFEFNE